MNRRVVITGVGLVTPLGIGVQESWQALCAGKSGVGEITRFDTSKFQTKIAAEVKGFRAEEFLPKKEAKRTERFIAYAIAATRMALEDSGLVIDDTNAKDALRVAYGATVDSMSAGDQVGGRHGDLRAIAEHASLLGRQVEKRSDR